MIQSYLKLQNNSQTRQDTLLTHLRMLARCQKQQNWLYDLPYYDQITSCLNLKLSKNQRRLSNLKFISKIFKSGGNICYSKISQVAFCIKQRWLKLQSHPAKIYLFEVYKFIPFCKRFSPSSTLSRCVAIFIRRKNLSPL